MRFIETYRIRSEGTKSMVIIKAKKQFNNRQKVKCILTIFPFVLFSKMGLYNAYKIVYCLCFFVFAEQTCSAIKKKKVMLKSASIQMETKTRRHRKKVEMEGIFLTVWLFNSMARAKMAAEQVIGGQKA